MTTSGKRPRKPATPRDRAAKLARADAFLERAAKAKTVGVKKARALLARIRRLKTGIAEDFYDLALCFHALQTGRGWSMLGYASFEQCVAAEKLFDPEGARQMVAIVAAKVSREAAVALGSYSAAYEALQITKATPAPDTVDGLVERDASIAGTKLVGSTVRKLRAARLSMSAKGEGERAEPPALAAARRSASRIAGSLAKLASVDVEGHAEPARPSPRVVITLDAQAASALAAALKKRAAIKR
ncbi:MAG: hypothetical protein IT379_22845 [Deltaproteobacteria bacterium]|nr:hypothetical protein [Deltaproteobacteria bacterium]